MRDGVEDVSGRTAMPVVLRVLVLTLLVGCTGNGGTGGSNRSAATVSPSVTPTEQSLSSAPPGLPNDRIAFGRFDPAVGDQVVYTISPDGTNLEQVSSGAAEVPRWSPDRSQILTVSDIVLTLDTPSEERLPQDPDFEPNEVLHGCAAWSPDGLTLACEVFFHNEPERNGLFLEAVRTGQLTRVTNSPGGEDNPGDFSPDGKRICFVRVDADRSEAANRAVHVVDVDGSHLQRISPWTGGGDLTSSWSPDGAWILYTANERIRAVHPDGSADHLIDIDLGTNVYSAFFPRWSEDGTWIVFSLARPDVYGLNVYVARADGSDAFQVTTALPGSQEVDEGDEFPDW